MKYHFKVHQEDGGYWAQGIELTGCFTQAETVDELDHNLKKALNLYIEEPAESVDLATLPDPSIKASNDVVEVSVDPHIAFAFLVRYYRIKHGLTQQEAARMMGFDTIYSYQRLESSDCNPTLKMLSKIKKLFPELSIDYIVGIEAPLAN